MICHNYRADIHVITCRYKAVCEAIPTVVERHRAAKPESQVWTGLNAVSLHSITQKSIEHRIGCNCGAFAPYFLLFGLLVAEHYTKIDRASSKGPAVSTLHTSNTLKVTIMDIVGTNY